MEYDNFMEMDYVFGLQLLHERKKEKKPRSQATRYNPLSGSIEWCLTSELNLPAGSVNHNSEIYRCWHSSRFFSRHIMCVLQ